MRISYLLNSRIPSDNAHVIQVLRMTEGLIDCGHEVTVFYPDRRQTDPKMRETTIADYYDLSEDIEFISLPYLDVNTIYGRFTDESLPQAAVSRGLFSLQAALRMRVESFDLHYTRGLVIAVLLVASGSPTVLEIHDQSISEWCGRLLSRIASSPVLRGIVTLTDPARETLLDIGVPSEKIYTEPDAVSLAPYRPLQSVIEARKALDLPTDSTYVGYTGSLTKGKGVRTLVDACRELTVTVLIVGGRDQERADLAAYLDKADIDTVRIEGQVEPSAVPAYQQAADVLVLPPRSDVENHRHNPETTSPLKLFEYMAARRPIVATRLPGIEDVLTHKENALLVQPGDPKAMRNAIVRLLDDESLRAALVEQAREDITEYTWRQRAADILASVK